MDQYLASSTCDTIANDKIFGPSQSLKPIVSSAKELSQPVETEVTGSIPKWLSGSILRNGSGEWDLDNPETGKIESVRHWFDGHALIHRFNIGMLTSITLRVYCIYQLI